MKEEEIITFLEEYKKTGYNTLYIKYNGDRHKINNKIEEAIQGLLDLYNKEKEKNDKEQKRIYNAGYTNGCNDTSKWNDKKYISKDKIRELLNKKFFIAEYNGEFVAIEDIEKCLEEE